MKKIIIMLVLLCFVSKATFAHVSKADLAIAKRQYLIDSMEYLKHARELHEQTVFLNMVDSLDTYGNKAHRDSTEYYITDMWKVTLECDRLFIEGLKDIRHDQKLWVKKR